MSKKVIFLTDTVDNYDKIWRVPDDWNPDSNTIEIIGSGQQGYTATTPPLSGRGGSYTKLTNVNIRNTAIVYSIGKDNHIVLNRPETRTIGFGKAVITGSISGNILTVTEHSGTPIMVGMYITDSPGDGNNYNNTIPTSSLVKITGFVSGSATQMGGVGTYTLDTSVTSLSSRVMYCFLCTNLEAPTKISGTAPYGYGNGTAGNYGNISWVSNPGGVYAAPGAGGIWTSTGALSSVNNGSLYGGGSGGEFSPSYKIPGYGAYGIIVISYDPLPSNRKTFFIKNSGSWTVPDDWNPNSNIIEIIGSGSAGSESLSSSGRGGGYCSVRNVAINSKTIDCGVIGGLVHTDGMPLEQQTVTFGRAEFYASCLADTLTVTQLVGSTPIANNSYIPSKGIKIVGFITGTGGAGTYRITPNRTFVNTLVDSYLCTNIDGETYLSGSSAGTNGNSGIAGYSWVSTDGETANSGFGGSVNIDTSSYPEFSVNGGYYGGGGGWDPYNLLSGSGAPGLIVVSYTPVVTPDSPTKKTIFLTNTANSTWTVPRDWNNSNNTIEAIGCGGWGTSVGTTGGYGGTFAKCDNLTLKPGTTIKYTVGKSADFNHLDTYFGRSQFIGSISGNILTVTSFTLDNPICAGMYLFGSGVNKNTRITGVVPGTAPLYAQPGTIGSYYLDKSYSLSSRSFYSHFLTIPYLNTENMVSGEIVAGDNNHTGNAGWPVWLTRQSWTANPGGYVANRGVPGSVGPDPLGTPGENFGGGGGSGSLTGNQPGGQGIIVISYEPITSNNSNMFFLI